ncbi:MAG: GNAT family N-acetyltransferase [Chlamydiia bacterium]|nr:GNAT family N-acetyltransferase [Chlamydiia bacterium]
MKNIRIRHFRLPDLLRLKGWINQSKKSFSKTFFEEIIYAIVNYFKFKAKRGCILTATINGRPVGMINLHMPIWKKQGGQTMFDIVVSEESRGKGIGTLLIVKAEQFAKETLGAKLMYLDVFEDNPAQNLYQRLGYTKGGFIPDYLKDGRGKVVMYKHL